jgi:deoxycytidine triphosphate deaminase
MFRSGQYVAEHVDPTTESQRQPNGVDLTAAAVHRQVEPGHIGRDGKTIGGRDRLEAVAPRDGDAADPVPTFELEPGGYAVEYGETIRVPEGHVGFVFPRSSLMRNSCMLNTAVWDAGYEGRGEGLLQVHHPIRIEAGARVAQFVLAEAGHDGTYDGSYQGERLDDE